MVLRTTCIKNIKFKVIKTRIGYQYIGYFYYSVSLNWAACGPRFGHSWTKHIWNIASCRSTTENLNASFLTWTTRNFCSQNTVGRCTQDANLLLVFGSVAACFFSWTWQFQREMKPWLHMEHLYGRSPVWVFMCAFKEKQSFSALLPVATGVAELKDWSGLRCYALNYGRFLTT